MQSDRRNVISPRVMWFGQWTLYPHLHTKGKKRTAWMLALIRHYYIALCTFVKQKYPFLMGKPEAFTLHWGSPLMFRSIDPSSGSTVPSAARQEVAFSLFNPAELCSVSHSQHESLNICRPDFALHLNWKDSIMYFNADFLPFFQNKTETWLEVFA